MANEVKRGKRRVEIGVVTRDKMDKTRRVEIPPPGQASALWQVHSPAHHLLRSR